MSMHWVNRLRLQSLFITAPIFKRCFFHLKRRVWWAFRKPWLALWRRENYQCEDRAKIFPMKRQDRRANGLVGRTSNCQRERLWIRDDWTETQSANKLVGWFPTGVSDPGIPLSPFDPDAPLAPASPFGPLGPLGPVAPVSPLGPWTAPWTALWIPWMMPWKNPPNWRSSLSSSCWEKVRFVDWLSAKRQNGRHCFTFLENRSSSKVESFSNQPGEAVASAVDWPTAAEYFSALRWSNTFVVSFSLSVESLTG